MYALKRMAAYVIDLVILFTPITAAITYGETQLLPIVPVHFHFLAGLGGMGVSILVPVVVVGTISGLTGTDPRETDHIPGRSRTRPATLRASLMASCGRWSKLFTVGFFFGMFWALQGMIANKRTFYDEWMDLDVEDLNPVGLTPTQKNFRKYMRQQARQKGR